MKIPFAKVDTFIKSPDANVRAALVYGPDSGLVAVRSKALMEAVIDDVNDPFRTVEMSYASIKDEPSTFFDELGAMSLTGGRRLIKIRDANTTLTKEIGEAILDTKSDTFTLFMAGDLSPSSTLRKFFEKEKTVAALPCYKDDSRSIRQVVETTLRQNGFSWDSDAIAYLSDSFSGDRMVVLAELEKLITYMGDQKRITYHDASACIDNSSEASLDMLCTAVADQNANAIDSALQRALSEGLAPIAILRSVLRYVMKLQTIKAQADTEGKSVDQVIAAIRPPVFFKQVPLLTRHSKQWRMPQISKVIQGLIDLEVDLKSSNKPIDVMFRRFFTVLPLAVKGK